MRKCDSCGKIIPDEKDLFCPHCGAISTKNRFNGGSGDNARYMRDDYSRPQNSDYRAPENEPNPSFPHNSTGTFSGTDSHYSGNTGAQSGRAFNSSPKGERKPQIQLPDEIKKIIDTVSSESSSQKSGKANTNSVNIIAKIIAAIVILNLVVGIAGSVFSKSFDGMSDAVDRFSNAFDDFDIGEYGAVFTASAESVSVRASEESDLEISLFDLSLDSDLLDKDCDLSRCSMYCYRLYQDDIEYYFDDEEEIIDSCDIYSPNNTDGDTMCFDYMRPYEDEYLYINRFEIDDGGDTIVVYLPFDCVRITADGKTEYYSLDDEDGTLALSEIPAEKIEDGSFGGTDSGSTAEILTYKDSLYSVNPVD